METNISAGLRGVESPNILATAACHALGQGPKRSDPQPEILNPGPLTLTSLKTLNSM